MSTEKVDIEHLAERLVNGDRADFAPAELDAVLNWLSGSERAGAAELIHLIGTPRERQDLTHSIFFRLDGHLFKCGQLIPERAHVDAGVDDAERRSRFRRLMTAFHPDHHPDDSDWLTPRSQAIHVAWRQFRTGAAASMPATISQAGRPQPPARPEGRVSARLIPISPAWLARVRARLQRVENLQGKAFLVIALIAFLPVAWMYFAYQPYRGQLPPQPHEPTAARPESQATPKPLQAPADQPDSDRAVTAAIGATIQLPDNASPSPREADVDRSIASPNIAPPKGRPESAVAEEAATPATGSARLSRAGDDREGTGADSLVAHKDRGEVAVPKIEPDPLNTSPLIDYDQAEQRISQLLDSYRYMFERGQLDGLLGHFTEAPRENRHEGRRWIRQNYQRLFENSSQRRINIEVYELKFTGADWHVDGRFDLQIDYPNRRSIRASRAVRYVIREENEQFRIARIEY